MLTTLQTKILEDAQGNKYAPVTVPSAVRWPNGDNLNEKLTTMGASGTNHKSGLVPDPGSTQGTTKYLREDGTWVVPGGGGGGGLPTGVSSISSLANIPTTYNVAFAPISINQSTVSISGGLSSLPAGCELHVIVSVWDDITITLPTAYPYILCGEDSALSASSNDVVEINFISTGNEIWVRAIKSVQNYQLP